MLVTTKQLTVAIKFHSIFFIQLKSMAPVNCLVVTNIFLNIFFCVQQLKPTHTGLKQLEDKYIMTELDFYWQTITLREAI